jgi:translation initiation factor 2 subunit 1
MFYQKTGFPEEGELALCTVTKVQYHSVFVLLEEYNKQGMIHISEVAPGRIRNIHDFVKEDKVVVCQVLRVNQERGYIDLSLRRVNENQRSKKVEQLKQEQKAETVVEFVAQQLKKNPKEVYTAVHTAISKHYPFLYLCFQDIVKNEITLEDLHVPREYQTPLEEVIRQRFKQEEVFVGGKLLLKSYAPDGVEIIKAALQKGFAAGKEQTQIRYLGAGAFNLLIKSGDYKDGERILKQVLQATEKALPKEATFEFVREEKKAATAGAA